MMKMNISMSHYLHDVHLLVGKGRRVFLENAITATMFEPLDGCLLALLRNISLLML